MQTFKKKIDFKSMHDVEEKLAGLNLHTVCHHARCPNISECFSRGEATFLILGDICTRGCAFCGVSKGTPGAIDREEPQKVAEAVKRMAIKYAVITSVTRDDLPDGGASIFAQCAERIKEADSKIKVELLVPDFKGDKEAIKKAAGSGADVFGHNVETVPSLYNNIRKGASYSRSLEVLKEAKKYDVYTKSALLLGFGEEKQEVLSVFRDLRDAGCDFLSIGQYLQPDKSRCEVKNHLQPEEFDYYKEEALKAGFLHVESGTYVRSSYRAENYLKFDI
jgi:lipoyl synthase